MVWDKVAWDRQAFEREGEMPRQMTDPSNIECVTVGQGEWDFWEGVRLKKGEKWREVSLLNEDASAS
jgi:hypothetical protein